MNEMKTILEFTVDDTPKAGRVVSIFSDKMWVGDVRYNKKQKNWTCTICKTVSSSLFATGCEHMRAAGAVLRERKKQQEEIWAKCASEGRDESPKPRRRFAPCPD